MFCALRVAGYALRVEDQTNPKSQNPKSRARIKNSQWINLNIN